MDVTCDVCETALVHDDGRPPHDIDVQQTCNALKLRVERDQMRYVRTEVPIEDMPALAESDLKYTIVSYLECRQCERTWFWGLCIRGAPIFTPVDADDPAKHPWDPVPPRELWAQPAS